MLADFSTPAQIFDAYVIPAKPIDEINVADRTLKVAAYVRVSTENDEQKSSYELQVNDFTDRIKGNPNWEFAGIYSEEEHSYPVLYMDYPLSKERYSL